MRIDAHQHVWDLEQVDYPWLGPEKGSIYRTFQLHELEPELQKCGIDKTILVQAMDSYEDTDFMLENAGEYDWIGGVVGWVPLDHPDEAAERLAKYVKNPVFKGVRHLIHEEEDPDWLIRDEVIEGLKVLASFGLPFDVVAEYPNHLPHVPTIAEKIPSLNMVVDHLAKPPILEKEMRGWKEQIARVATYPHVYAKVSGLNTAADPKRWSADDLKPYIDTAFELFGSERLMFGSDWPVLTLAGDYGQVWDASKKVLSTYSKDEQDDVFGHTANRFYNM